MHSRKIVFLNQSTETHEKARKLSEKLHLKFNPVDLSEYEFALHFNLGRLELSWLKRKEIGAIGVDLSQTKLKRASLKDSLLAKAIGVKRDEKPTILDACAGLGMDGLTLALMGCKVVFLERSPILFELLTDGLDRIPAASLKERPLLLLTDAKDYLDKLNPEHYPDVIYLDPMYPDRNKNALAKKEMQILQVFLGEDFDAEALFEKARRYAKKRVVVKRRRSDKPLGNKKPNLSFTGSAVRFDVYVI